MRKTEAMFAAFAIVLSLSGRIAAEEYRFTGKDSGAFREKLAAAKPGDTFLLRRGDSFTGAFKAAVKGSAASPVLIAPYGEGPLPVVTDLAPVSGWRKAGKNLWRAVLPQNSAASGRPPMLLRDGVQLPLARFPNADATWGGYLPISSHEGKSLIVSKAFGKGPSWVGAEAVVRTRRWILDRARVVKRAGAAITLGDGLSYEPYDGFGFFLQDHPDALDAEGEWCRDGEKGGILLYSSRDPSSSVFLAPTGGIAADFGGSSFLILQGIEFRGGSEAIMNLSDTESVAVRSCAFALAGKDAVIAWNARGLAVEASSFGDTQNNAFRAASSSGLRLVGNRFDRTALRAGMGAGTDGQYNAIDVHGTGMLVEGNVVERTGYLPIAFSGDDVTIRRNVVDGFALVKDDAGGIYTWSDGKKPGRNRLVVQNVVRNGIGAPEGQSWAGGATQGIYVDDRSSGVRLEGNLVYRAGESGIMIHNAHDLEIEGNVLFGNGTQMLFVHDGIAPDHPVKDVRVRGNVLCASDEEEVLARLVNRDDDEAIGAVFEANAYASPFRREGVFVLQTKAGAPERADLARWTGAGGRDRRGAVIGGFVAPIEVIGEKTGNLIRNGGFSSGLEAWGWWANHGSGVAELRGTAAEGSSPAVRLSFAKPSGKPDSHFLFHSAPFPVKKGGLYRLRFIARSSSKGYALSFLTRKHGDPWTQSSEEAAFILDAEPRPFERLFAAETDEPSTRAEFIIREGDLPRGAALKDLFAEISDVDIREVEVRRIDASKYLRFHPNASAAPMRVVLDGEWIDAKGRRASGTVEIPPFSAGIFVKE